MSFKYPVVMPKMSMTMETGELIGYHVKAGDSVKTGDVLFEVMTDKIDMEVEAPADGVIESLVAEPGAVIDIGKPVLIMLTETQIMAFDFSGDEAPVVAQPVALAVVEAPVPAPAVVLNNDVKAVPKARVEAAKRGIDLRTIQPTGPDRTIMMADINSAQADPAVRKRQAANKALIAKGIAMGREIPQSSFSRSVSTNFDHARLISSWARILRSRPDLSIRPQVGVAVIIESKYGSALPVFKDPDLMSLADLTSLISSTSSAAVNGKVPLEMLSGATTTIFDLTSYSMNAATPLLFPNQITSVTVGYESATTRNISLTIDLRYCDFYDGAQLLDALAASL
ncbi:unannotated protein [freshwater metagenome]|uniref:Unannotated protein n=1 Tax=freshwater metagenome TaxID=449393 RepID=A0A6J7WBT8_9ZZZZ|nr:hypothetical protein [Actinomycetota bacterium]MSW62669.1 hypothetical protein [Actinomycetota bacterium]MSX89765.1 hypothetical protein [Actinomycetota bacterium]MSZ63780.1 hypothetical protein [Actinomycetota bacterium]MTA58550.1 hypothetical protein [Actinomycetota bacterium]